MNLNLQSPIAILGFGTEGQDALRFLQGRGIKDITVCDHKADLKAPDGVKARLGRGAFGDLSDFRTVIRSPGVRLSDPQVKEAVDSGCFVTSMTKLTLDVAGERVTAITGTNGKTTTVALAGQILSAHYGGKFIMGGNGKRPVLQEALDHPTWPILIEASSFQFHDAKKSPYIAAVTNITPDHQNWHATMEEYIEAKKNILRHQKQSDWAILNANNENSAKLSSATPAQLFWVGQKRGPHWVLWEGDHLLLTFDGKTEVVIRKDQLNYKTHPENTLFAAAIAKLHFVPATVMAEQMRAFRGVEQRLQFVRTVRGIDFYNDSCATTPEAVMMGIDQFDPKRLILLMGGSSKNADFSFLARQIVEKGVRVYLYGQEGKRIQEAIIASEVAIPPFDSAQGRQSRLVLNCDQSGDFKKIIESAFKLAKPEDSISLSPACASFDMFKNSKERGYQFDEIVNKL
jgi:UDP-N-acetylmuramoylalanine--D-glutamate ligase